MRLTFFVLVSTICLNIFGQNTLPIPSNFRINSTECGKITLEWDAVPKPNNASFIGYIIEKSQDNSYWYGMGYNVLTETTFIDSTQMDSNHTYYYKIKTRIDGSESLFSSSISTLMTCQKPSNLRIISTDCGNINIAWDPLVSNNIKGYIIYLYDPNENNKLLQIGEVGANINSFSVSGFAYSKYNISINSISNTDYSFVVKAKIFNTISEISNIITAQFNCPTTPAPRVITQDCMNIKIVWDDFPAQFEETGFEIFRASDKNGRYRLINSVGPNVLEFVQKDIYTGEGGYNEVSVVSDRNYYYKICGKFNKNRSQFSDSVMVNVHCNVPSALRVTESTCNTSKLAWDPLPANSGVTSYGILGSENYYDGDYQYIGYANANQAEYTFNKWDYQPRYKFFKIYANYQNAYSSSGSLPAYANYTCIENGFINTQINVKTNNCTGIELNWANFSPIYSPNKLEIIRTWLDENNIIQNEIQELNSIFGSGATGFSEYRKLINGIEYKYTLKITVNGNIFYTETKSVIFNCNANIALAVNNGNNCSPMTAQWNINNVALATLQFEYSTNPNGPFSYLKNFPSNENTIPDLNKLNIFLPNNTYYFRIISTYGNNTIYSNVAIASFNCNSNITLNSSSNCTQFILNWTDNEPNIPNNGYLLMQESFNYPTYTFIPKDTYSYSFDATVNKLKFKVSKKIGTVISNFSNEIEQNVQNCYNKPIITITQTDCKFIKFSIDLNNNLNGKLYSMHLYRYTDPNKLDLIGYNLKQNEFFDITTGQYNYSNEVNKNYFYKLILVLDNLRFESDPVVGSFICPLNNPVSNLSILTNCNTINLNWDSAANPKNNERIFYVYRSETGINGDYKIVYGNYTPTGFVDHSNFEPQKTYYYKVGYSENQLMQTLSVPISFTYQRIMASMKSGNWEDPTVWSCFRIPSKGDIITIKQGHNIENNSHSAILKSLNLKGNINIKSNSTLTISN